MKERFKHFDAMKIAGLRPKRKAKSDVYATFHQRLLAATIDSLLLALIAGPFLDGMVDYYYGVQSLDWGELQQRMQAQAGDSEQVRRVVSESLHESGLIERSTFAIVLQIVTYCLFSGLCWSLWSATPGKMLLRLKVVDVDTMHRLTPEQVALRMAGYVLSALPLCIGFFWIGMNKRHQGWHDTLAHTAVVYASKAKITPDSQAADPSNSPAP